MYTQQISAFVMSDNFLAGVDQKSQIISLIENLNPIIISASHGLLGIGYT